MNDEDRDLLQKLSQVGNILGDVVAGILHDTISRDEQIGLVYWLADAAEAMRARAFRTPGDVIEGSVIEESVIEGRVVAGRVIEESWDS